MEPNLKTSTIASSILPLLFLFSGCSGGGSKNGEDVANGREETQAPSPAVCIWQGTPVRKSPGQAGEWMTNLNVGESFKALEKTKKASTGDEKKEYRKIRMKGGDEGWTRSELIAVNAQPRVVTKEAKLLERPDPMSSQGDKSFEPLDIVASKKTEKKWLQVKGKRRKGDWIEEGWIKKAKTSDRKEGITLAGLYHRAVEKKDGEELKKELRELIDEYGTGGPLEKVIQRRHLKDTATKASESAGNPSSLELTRSAFGPLKMPPSDSLSLESLREKFPEYGVEKKKGQQDGPDFTFYRISIGGRALAEIEMDGVNGDFDQLKVIHPSVEDDFGVRIGMPYKKLKELRPAIDHETGPHSHTYAFVGGSRIAYEIDGDFEGPDREEFEDETVQDWKVTKILWKKDQKPSKS